MAENVLGKVNRHELNPFYFISIAQSIRLKFKFSSSQLPQKIGNSIFILWQGMMKGGSNIAKNNTHYSVAKEFKDLTFGL